MIESSSQGLELCGARRGPNRGRATSIWTGPKATTTANLQSEVRDSAEASEWCGPAHRGEIHARCRRYQKIGAGTGTGQIDRLAAAEGH